MPHPAVALLLSLLLSSLTTVAAAHPSAISGFELRAYGDDISVGFTLDATSVVDLVERHSPAKDVAKRDVIGHRRVILSYIDARWAMRGSQACTRQKGTKLAFGAADDRVRVSARYRCPERGAELAIDSTLFHDEKTPHRIIGSVRHARATERYFLSKNERNVRIDFARLERRGGDNRQFRMAAPPAGAFDGNASAAPAGSPLAGPGASSAPDDPTSHAPAATFGAFVEEGIVHIIAGLDHVLFLLCLVVAIRRWRDLALMVTSFTIAHTLTLVLTTLGLVQISPLIVEPAIALTIIYVAVENIVREEPRHRIGITFGFGLIHGLGFGGALASIGLPSAKLLFAFNVGVEIGQLLLIVPLFAGVRWLAKQPKQGRRVAHALCAMVAVAGCWWFVERVFTL